MHAVIPGKDSFAQLTYRESLRDIEACFLDKQSRLYGMSFRTLV